MNVRRVATALAALCIIVMASDARADIIFSTDQGSLQPDEQLLFGDSTGTTVQGHTNTTGTLFNISSDETLVANGGQATVSALDGSYNLFLIQSTDPSAILFSEFEANVVINAKTSGTATVTACNQSGTFVGFDPGGSIGDGQPCEVFNYTLNSGSNFFVLSVADSQLLSGVEITTDVGMVDVRQVRLSPATANGDPLTPLPAVPEPASLVLLGSGLLVGARTMRRRAA